MFRSDRQRRAMFANMAKFSDSPKKKVHVADTKLGKLYYKDEFIEGLESYEPSEPKISPEKAEKFTEELRSTGQSFRSVMEEAEAKKKAEEEAENEYSRTADEIKEGGRLVGHEQGMRIYEKDGKKYGIYPNGSVVALSNEFSEKNLEEYIKGYTSLNKSDVGKQFVDSYLEMGIENYDPDVRTWSESMIKSRER